jgi:hypothetical protein
MNLPDWTPVFLQPLLERMDRHPSCSGHRRAVFERLVTDPKMRMVYDEFVRRDRKTGEFLHRAKNRADEQSVEDAQMSAIREVLQLTVSAASDRISVSKLEQIEEAQQRWGNIATRLRELAHDMELAAKLEMLGLDDPVSKALGMQDLQTLRRVAKWVDHLTSAVRRPGDPLIVRRHRGDPIVRGVQIMISIKLEEQFGERLDGTAATLTSVALGAETTPRVSRSALTERNSTKKAQSNRT